MIGKDKLANVGVSATTVIAIGAVLVGMGVVPSKAEFDSAIKRQEDKIEQLDDTLTLVREQALVQSKEVNKELASIRQILSTSASQFEIATLRNTQVTENGFASIKNQLEALGRDRWTFTNQLRFSSQLETDNKGTLTVPNPSLIRDYGRQN